MVSNKPNYLYQNDFLYKKGDTFLIVETKSLSIVFFFVFPFNMIQVVVTKTRNQK